MVCGWNIAAILLPAPAHKMCVCALNSFCAITHRYGRRKIDHHLNGQQIVRRDVIILDCAGSGHANIWCVNEGVLGVKELCREFIWMKLDLV